MYSYTNVKMEIYEYKSHARQWDETTRQTVAINLSKFGPKTLWTGHKIGIQIFHETKNRSWKFIRNINAHFFSCSSYFKLTNRFVDWGGFKWCGLVIRLGRGARMTSPKMGPILGSCEPGHAKRSSVHLGLTFFFIRGCFENRAMQEIFLLCAPKCPVLAHLVRAKPVIGNQSHPKTI
jgi:hypothetical protein